MDRSALVGDRRRHPALADWTKRSTDQIFCDSIALKVNRRNGGIFGGIFNLWFLLGVCFQYLRRDFKEARLNKLFSRKSCSSVGNLI